MTHPLADEARAMLPCPFCGGDARTEDASDWGGGFYATCSDCYCCVGEAYDRSAMPSHVFQTEAEAVAAWNRRADALDAATGEPGDHADLVARITSGDVELLDGVDQLAAALTASEAARKRAEAGKVLEGVPALIARIRELEAERDRRTEMHECAMSERDDATLYADEQKARAEAAEATVGTLTAQVEAMRGELAEANRRLGGGCDANSGGDHHVITQGKYHFCANCGESLTGIRFCHLPRAALTTEKTNG